jgi:hypothetical protein
MKTIQTMRNWKADGPTSPDDDVETGDWINRSETKK